MRRIISLFITLLASLSLVNADDTYVKVTSSSQLVVGDEYIIAADNAGTVYVATAFSSNALSSTNVGFTVEGNIITVSTASPLVFTLGGNAEGYTLKFDDTYYLGYSNSSTDLEQSITSTSNKEKWTYNYNDTYASYLLQNVADAGRYLLYHYGSVFFKAYKETSFTNLPAAALYKKSTGSSPATPTHTVNWSVNGVVTPEEVAEGDAISFTNPESGIPAGYTFVGWTSSAIPEPQALAPDYVSSATMSTSDITYYAVMAVVNDNKHTVTLTAKSEVETGYTDRILTDNDDNTWNAYCANSQIGGMYLYRINTTSDCYIESPVFPDNIDEIKVLAYNDNLDNRLLYFKSFKDGLANLGTISVPKGEKATHELSLDISGQNSNKFFIQAGVGVLDIKQIKVTYGTTTYSHYCTSAAPSNIITLAAACTDGVRYYGTYSSGNAFVVPSDLTVAEIKVAESKLTVSNYATGDVVPANTGVMVSAATAGAHPVVISGETGTSVLGAENMLKPSGNGITAGEMAEANSGCKFYRLTMHGGTTLGYYYGAAGGAAFALAANKAYLAVPTAGARTGFDWAEETTGIADVSISGTTDNATPCYNLNGQRVTEAAKGIVIRNGKKIMKR